MLTQKLVGEFSTPNEYNLFEHSTQISQYLSNHIRSEYLSQQEPLPPQTKHGNGTSASKLYDNRIFIKHAITYGFCFLTYLKVKA